MEHILEASMDESGRNIWFALAVFAAGALLLASSTLERIKSFRTQLIIMLLGTVIAIAGVWMLGTVILHN